MIEQKYTLTYILTFVVTNLQTGVVSVKAENVGIIWRARVTGTLQQTV